ncbi:MAG: nicotinate phosphoribosyltransferase [Chloroflexi bacterium]|nr:nicotinate phosphoribosyltransferase [Chloroflexota bacterium]
MTIFDHQRLNAATLKLDVDGLRRGWYSDKYFENVVRVLEGARKADYHFNGVSPRPLPVDPSPLKVGEIRVEAQIFNRRAPRALNVGIDAALAMLRHAAGYDDGGQFVERWRQLEVEAAEDGTFTDYEGDTEDVQPVLKIRGCYRDFALLETPILGVLTRASRIATNVYEALVAARGKPVLFFPARFDLPEVQPADGYAYWVAVQRYNHDSGAQVAPLVSTDAQAAWWGGRGGGTVPHALIACYLGDTVAAMMAFAEYVPVDVPRIALVDFNNDSVGASVATLRAYWPRYQAALLNGDAEERKRWTLYGVRLDTSANMRDVSLGMGDGYGVSAELVRVVRQALDNAWQDWNVTGDMAEAAQAFCRGVKIVASGGFKREKIEQFEKEGVPVDIYGVGSTFLRNDAETNTDFTMDVVRVEVEGRWVEMAKLGRKPNDHPNLQAVDLSQL